MATAPAQTFQDWPADPKIQAIIDSIPRPRPRAVGDTLTEVIADPVRRNKLIDDNNLLKGIRMTADGPTASSRELIVRPDTLSAMIDNSATINTTTVEAEFTETLMQSNYNSVSVKVSAPFATASASYSNESSYKNTETQKTIMTSSRYLFPQGRIDFSPPGSGFRDDIQLSPAFMDAVNAALGKGTRAEQREGLWSIQEEYGHVFRTRVTIGGTLSAHTMETFNRSENETSVKEDIKASLEASVMNWGAGVEGGHGNTQTTITTSQGRRLDVKYIVQGGDYTQIQDSSAWIASTNQSEYWRAIEVVQVVPIFDMLPDDIKGTVNMLMTPLLGQWVPVEMVRRYAWLRSEIDTARAGTIPDGWYFLGHSVNVDKTLIVKPAFPPRSGRNVAVSSARLASGSVDQPMPDLPQYQFLSSYFSQYSPGISPDQSLGALRPGLFLEGRWDVISGPPFEPQYIITRPNTAQDPADECFDLSSVVDVNEPSSGAPPRPRWVLRKDAVLFDSGEQ